MLSTGNIGFVAIFSRFFTAHKKNWGMNFKKGQSVIAKDWHGKPHHVRVWKEAKYSVFVASNQLFQALDNGDFSRWPVAVPKTDVSVASMGP